ncbi:ABC transporter substrate-binding protein [Streptomyces montanus]|uniref:ABC transporter substrate-binding protein n=1 Tax=Streptomyces montanus TaxID=2580423 RepID=A0A5R9G551_9ACTN|nr:ABC transporter substrate-binding protein [Streptomyces montanus]TLS46675.1 ABC transporter substrate-binding protein [Streptomyces montanus]
MRKRLRPGASCAIALGLALSLGACSGGVAKQASGTAGTINVEAPNSAPTFTNNFNPFSQSDTGPGLNIIYEPLLASNRAKGGVLIPWLAKSWAWSDGGRTATLTLRPGVKFSDGNPLTPADVVYSLDLLLKNPKLGGATYSAVKAVGSDAVAVTWKSAAYQQLGDLKTINIIEKKLWVNRKPLTYVDKNPVGTGPFAMKAFSPQAVTMAARTDYWGGKPAMANLKYVAATSANIQTQLQNNSIDFCTCDIDAKSYVASDPQRHRFIMAWDGSVVSVMLNNGKAPFSDVHVRRAFADAVDTAAIAKLASSKLPLQEPPASPTGLSTKTYKDWIDPKYLAPRKQDVAAAKASLQAGGYTVQGGRLMKDGKQLPVTFVAPSDTPFIMTIAQLVIQQIKQTLGIDIKLSGGANASDEVAKGKYDLASTWLSSGEGIYTALNQFNGSLASPIGTEASNNSVRFRNAAFDKVLAEMAGTDDQNRLKQLGMQAQAIFVDQVPTIPLFSSGAAGVANTRHWTGWPPAANPDYLANTGSGTELITTLLHLKPAKG